MEINKSFIIKRINSLGYFKLLNNFIGLNNRKK